MAFKNKPDSDSVVGLAAGRRGADVYILDRVKGQWTFTESCHQLRALAKKYISATLILVEDKANGPAVIDSLHHEVSGIVPVEPEGGKLARAQAVQPQVEPDDPRR